MDKLSKAFSPMHEGQRGSSPVKFKFGLKDYVWKRETQHSINCILFSRKVELKVNVFDDPIQISLDKDSFCFIPMKK